MTVPDWQREIDELHQFFEAWFQGRVSSLERAENAFSPDFTHIGPDGELRTREQIVTMLHHGRGHSDTLRITTSGHRLVLAGPDAIVATYIESHDLPDRRDHRISTVTFIPAPGTPNGLHWLHVQETCLPDSA